MKKMRVRVKKGNWELLPRSVLTEQNKNTSGLIKKSYKPKYFPMILLLLLPFTVISLQLR